MVESRFSAELLGSFSNKIMFQESAGDAINHSSECILSLYLPHGAWDLSLNPIFMIMLVK